MSAGLIDTFLELFRSNFNVFMTLIPLAGSVVGLVGMVIAMRRILPPDDVSARWRYREPALDVGVVKGYRPPWRWDGPRGKAVARAMIVFAVLLPLAVLIALVARPGHIGGGMFDAPPWYAAAMPWAAGAIGYLVGLGWMIRIYRADPEPVQPIWRYRD
jgi:hypothetical protein